MGFYSELDAEGPYHTCGEADEARRFYPDEYRVATQAWPISPYTCLFCGAPGYPSACPRCVGEGFDGPPVPPSEGEPGEPQPAPPIGTDFETRQDTPDAGAAIYRQFHRDRYRFLVVLRGLDRDAWTVLAEAYCAYLLRHGARLTPNHIVSVWSKAVNGDIALPPRVHQLLVEADASAESYAHLR